MTARKRTRRYRQDIAWRWLKRHPGAQAPALARHLDVNNNTAAHLLQRLKRTGYARTGYLDNRRADRCVVWFAIGDRPPSCLWGTAPGSITGLQIGWDNWAPSLALAQKALGRTVKPRDQTPKPMMDAHPLSVAWR